MKENLKKYSGVGIMAFAVFLAVRYWSFAEKGISVAWHAGLPLLMGCIVAYVVNILMSSYEKLIRRKVKEPKKFVRPVCVVLAYASLILILIFLFNMILPELWACIQLLGQKLPGVMEDIVDFMSQYADIDEEAFDELFAAMENINWKDIAERLAHSIGGAINAAVTVLGSVISFVVTAVLAIVFSTYVLMDKERLGRGVNNIIKAYFPEKFASRLQSFVRTVDDCFHKFIVGQCVEAVILGTLCIAGMLILRIPYATMIGTLVGFTALIPVAGAYIGAIVGALMIASESYMKAFIFIIFLIILQQLEGNLIYPKVVGSSIGLPGILVLAAITVGGGVWGIGGMLIGVPITAAAYTLIKNDVEARRKAKEIPPEPAENIKS